MYRVGKAVEFLPPGWPIKPVCVLKPRRVSGGSAPTEVVSLSLPLFFCFSAPLPHPCFAFDAHHSAVRRE